MELAIIGLSLCKRAKSRLCGWNMLGNSSQNMLPRKEDSEFVASSVPDATVTQIGSNFEESDSDELSDSLASPALKPDKNCINNLSRL